MTARWWFLIAALLGLVLVGCLTRAALIPQTHDKEGLVRGSVAYRERMALLPDAVVEVWITDVSPLVLAAPVIAETTVLPEGRQVPIPFELRYDRSRIEPVRAADESSGATDVLRRTAWRLEDLGGAGVVDRVEATLQFPEAGKAVGSGSCNRFFGTFEISGQSIKFGPLGTTRMSCVEAVMHQEAKYLRALQEAERFTLEGSTLLIYYKGTEKPLRFLRKEP